VIDDPSVVRLNGDRAAPSYLAGIARGIWREVSLNFPILIVEIAATEPDGTAAWYRMRIEASGYPGHPPEVRIWDTAADRALPANLRPKGNSRVQTTFQQWGDDTAYRPWDRKASVHNNFREKHPQLAWHAGRDLAFILEDLHGILNLNARQRGVRSAA